MRKQQSNSNLVEKNRNAWTVGGLVLALSVGVFLAAPSASAEVVDGVDASKGVTFLTERRETIDLRSDPRILASRAGLSPVDLSRDRLARPPRYQERPTGEWQGMRVDLNVRQACSSSDQCGNALVCVRGACSPCSTDDQCGEGAVCALDHCVLKENASCQRREDCAGTSSENASEDALCMLSGYSHAPRGNEEMEAFCAVPTGGTAQSEEDHERLLSTLDARSVKVPVPVDGAALLADVERHLSEAASGEDGVEIIDPYYSEEGVEIIDPYYFEGGIDPIDSVAPIDPEGDTRANEVGGN